MALSWLNLSTRWGLTSVQAALNVIISVLGTLGIWASSRFWWQRGAAGIVRGESDVPLSALVTLSSPGEGWDVVAVLRKKVFARENWRLLVQLVVVVGVTVVCMLAGPIAKVSLRSTRTVQRSSVDVLNAVSGDSFTANLLEANVLWNDTIRSLNDASYPYTQMLDFLPPSTVPWTYTPREWDPTWTMECNYTSETELHNVTATGNSTFYDPIGAFPQYRDTYDESWLDPSQYRVQVDFSGWSVMEPVREFTDVLFFILIQSDPEVGNRLYGNNGTIRWSMSVLHTSDFNASNYYDVTLGAETTWLPTGAMGNASYVRTECEFARRPSVANESAIPWLWTNDTYSITYGYRTYWSYLLEDHSSKGLPVLTPSPQELLRYYQAYMASVNTIYAFAAPRTLSVWKDTVQLSTTFLVMILLLFVLTLWLSVRYFVFLRRHRAKLEELYVPDGRLEWMLHGAKVAANATEQEVVAEGARLRDRDYLRTARFGHGSVSVVDSSTEQPRSRSHSLARIYSNTSGPAAPRAANRHGLALCKSTASLEAPDDKPGSGMAPAGLCPSLSIFPPAPEDTGLHSDATTLHSRADKHAPSSCSPRDSDHERTPAASFRSIITGETDAQ